MGIVLYVMLGGVCFIGVVNLDMIVVYGGVDWLKNGYIINVLYGVNL